MTTEMPRLTDTDADKLGKILGRLGSDFEGERAAAALLATGFLRERGMRWADLVVPRVVKELVPVPARFRFDLYDVHEIAHAGLHGRRDLLSDWEREFLADVRWKPKLSPKQSRILERIALWLWHNGQLAS